MVRMVGMVRSLADRTFQPRFGHGGEDHRLQHRQPLRAPGPRPLRRRGDPPVRHFCTENGIRDCSCPSWLKMILHILVKKHRQDSLRQKKVLHGKYKVTWAWLHTSSYVVATAHMTFENVTILLRHIWLSRTRSFCYGMYDYRERDHFAPACKTIENVVHSFAFADGRR